MSEYHPVARADGVHVLSEMCATCVFRPGNLMHLPSGRLKGMIQTAIADQSCIPCHSTIRREDEVQPSICHGFFSRYADRILPLRLARVWSFVIYDNPPPKELP